MRDNLTNIKNNLKTRPQWRETDKESLTNAVIQVYNGYLDALIRELRDIQEGIQPNLTPKSMVHSYWRGQNDLLKRILGDFE